jgi:hypothetical protein
MIIFLECRQSIATGMRALQSFPGQLLDSEAGRSSQMESEKI